MEKADIKKRVDKMRDDAKKNNKGQQKAKSIELKPGEKICPFSLGVGGLPCGGWCQLHRSGKTAFACPLQEIPTIGWNTRK